MIRNFFTAEQLGPAYSELKNDLRLGTPTAVYGVSPDMPLLAEALRREGFTEDEVEAISVSYTHLQKIILKRS